MCFQKLFAVSSSHPHLRSRSGATAKKRRQPCWQLPLFKAPLMARQILLTPPHHHHRYPKGTPTGGRWGYWLWLLAMADQPIAVICSAPKKSMRPLSRKRPCLCEAPSPNLRHGCHEAVSAWQAPGWWSFHPPSALSGRRCLQLSLLVSYPTWHIPLLKTLRRNLSQLGGNIFINIWCRFLRFWDGIWTQLIKSSYLMPRTLNTSGFGAQRSSSAFY